MKQLKTTVIVLALIALIFPVSIIYRLVHQDELITLPEKIKWIDGATGKEIPLAEHDDKTDWTGCSWITASEYKFRTDDGLWVACDYPTDSSTSMAYIDLRQKVGTVWVFPSGIEPYYSGTILGITRNEDGEIAIVFRSDNDAFDFYLAILDKNGWIQEPVLIEMADVSKVFATRWKGDSVELIYEHSSLNSDETFRGYTLKFAKFSNGSIEKKPINSIPDSLCMEGAYDCFRSCKVFFEDGKWHSVYRRHYKSQSRRGYLIVDEHGNTLEVDEEGLCPSGRRIDRNFDQSFMGAITDIYVYRNLSRDDHRFVVKNLKGEFEKKGKPNPSWEAYHSASWFRLGGNSLAREYLWRLPNNDNLILSRKMPSLKEPSNWLYTIDFPGDQLLIAMGDSQGIPDKANIVSVVDNYYCGYLVAGVPVPKPEGGFWLVTSQGCFLDLDKDLNRLNSLSVIDHLNTGGGWRFNAYEPQHLYKVIWIIIGLPILLFISWIFTLIFTENKFKTILNGLVIYLVSAGICWYQVFSLLLP